ncbi:agmatine deiminase family protein [Pelovirga terrestris]
MTSSHRLPAEWEAQDAVLLAWPHHNSDWVDILDEVLPVYLDLARQISRFERVIIITPEPEVVRAQLRDAGIVSDRIHLINILTNDTWIRDFGPITVFTNGHPCLLDFGFNGWGLKFAADMDNLVTRQLARTPLFSAIPTEIIGLMLEGGSIESDGKGTLLTTSNCLLNPNRNPHLTKGQLETELRTRFGLQQILWLDHGWLAGDDTDAHIDTIARLCPDDRILYVRCDDPQDEHYDTFQRMEQQLRSFTTTTGTPFRLIPLPWPQAQYEGEQRLPATYANFLIINGAVLVPCYQDAADQKALETIGACFPEREIIGIDCRPLIKQHGSLHCVTMQLPTGVVS